MRDRDIAGAGDRARKPRAELRRARHIDLEALRLARAQRPGRVAAIGVHLAGLHGDPRGAVIGLERQHAAGDPRGGDNRDHHPVVAGGGHGVGGVERGGRGPRHGCRRGIGIGDEIGHRRRADRTATAARCRVAIHVGHHRRGNERAGAIGVGRFEIERLLPGIMGYAGRRHWLWSLLLAASASVMALPSASFVIASLCAVTA